MFNFYYDQIIILVDKYLIKYMTIYCESHDDIDLNKKLKIDKSLINNNNNSNSVSIGNYNSNIYVNTPSHLENNSLKPSTSSTVLLQNENFKTHSTELINITNLDQIDSNFISHFIKECIKTQNNMEFNDLMYNKFMRQTVIEYKIDTNLLNFFNQYIGLISSSNISKNHLIEFIHKLYDIDLIYKYKLNTIKSELFNQMIELNNFKDLKYNSYLSALNEYRYFCNYGYRELQDELAQNHITKINEIENEQQTNISNEMNKFSKQPNKISNFFKKSLNLFEGKSNTNINTNSNNSFIDENLDDYCDLFYKPNKSTTSINSNGSDKTIKQSDYNKSQESPINK